MTQSNADGDTYEPIANQIAPTPRLGVIREPQTTGDDYDLRQKQIRAQIDAMEDAATAIDTAAGRFWKHDPRYQKVDWADVAGKPSEPPASMDGFTLGFTLGCVCTGVACVLVMLFGDAALAWWRS